MRSYNVGKLFSEIESVVKSKLSVAEGFQRVIQFCAREVPHPDWAPLHALDVDGDASHLREWLETIMHATSPPAEVTGLWFGLFNPIVDGRPTADVRVIGAPYSSEDPDWIFRERWGQGTPRAGSAVLDAVLQIAYGREDSLGIDAEYPLCLVYAALAIRQLAQSMGPELLRDAEQRVLNVGFDSGDFICIGALRHEGLVFSRNSETME